MTPATFDITAFTGLHEGQHFDRKSLFQGPEGKKVPRDRKTVRDQVAEYVAAFANAEGGVLILGIEDDGTETGHRYPHDAVVEILRTPTTRLSPAQPEGFRIPHAAKEFLVFDVPAADGPVQVVGDGFPLRMGDRTVQASESQIQALKFQGLVESWEGRPSAMRLGDLEPSLVARAKAGAGLSALPDDEFLIKRKLADRRGRDLVLRKSAELLFAQSGPDHPNAGVRLFRVVGTERRLGAAHNVEERPRIEGNLPSVLAEVFGVMEGLIRRPSRLVGSRFRQVPEYPEFSWKEAILNAVAHRDYSVQGRTTEIWMFDDRMEISSPGTLLPPVSIADLLAHRRIHVSRNPRLVRLLVDLGLMRDQGEGIPRMFAEMEGLFLPEPTIETPMGTFCVTLWNTPVLSRGDTDWLAGLGDIDLSDRDVRALLEVRRHGQIDNSRLREMTGLDTLAASQILRHLRDIKMLQPRSGGAQTYYVEGDAFPRAGAATPHSGETHKLEDETHEFPGETHKLEDETHKFPGQTHEQESESHGLSIAIRARIAALGQRPNPDELRKIIQALCAMQPRRAAELTEILGRRQAIWLTRHHLVPMVRDGQLRRLHPENPNHPRQAYVAVEEPGNSKPPDPA